jgi:hypothetical protein
VAAKLTIEVSDELFDCLARQSAQEGKTPETLAAECLGNLLIHPERGRLRRWAGSHASNVPDASLRHDDYLGQALYQELEQPAND